MNTTTYQVKGMTCGHCVSTVKTEIGRIAGVADVLVDLDSGLVSVSSESPVEEAAVRAAVDEAGYEVVA